MEININGLYGDLFAIDGFIDLPTKLKVKKVNYIGKSSYKVNDILFTMFPNTICYTYTLLNSNEKLESNKSGVDFYVSTFFNKNNKFIHSSFKQSLCSVKKFCLTDYVFVHLKSKGKHLSSKEIKQIDQMNLNIVVIGTEEIKINLPKRWINLINETTLLESIEILKNSTYFFGVNSCFSVLSDKLLNNILIKCVSTTNKKFYYPLHYNKDVFYDYRQSI